MTAALAGRIAAAVAGDGATAALFARRMIGGAWITLQELCHRFRYVTVVTDAGWTWALDGLRRRTGVSILEQPSPRQLQQAAVAVFFDVQPPGLELPAGCVAIGARAGALAGVRSVRKVTGLSPVTCGRERGGAAARFSKGADHRCGA